MSHLHTAENAPSQAQADAGLGLIGVAGEDAAEFLQAQLSNDISRVDDRHSMLAAWCDAKGRTQSLMRVLYRDSEYLLVVPRELIAPLLKRLRLFVLRSRVSLRDAGEDLRVHGLVGDAAAGSPVGGVSAPAVVRDGARQYLALAGPVAHCLLIAPADDVVDDAADVDQWRYAGILAGMPQIVAPTQGRFVPQMLNLHWLDGIAFDKGCYPGQEVVARLQYRGKLTRRLYAATLARRRTPPPGTAVVDESGDTQGEVVDAAPEDGQQAVLAVLRVDAAARPLYVEEEPLALRPLPYDTPDPD